MMDRLRCVLTGRHWAPYIGRSYSLLMCGECGYQARWYRRLRKKNPCLVEFNES